MFTGNNTVTLETKKSKDDPVASLTSMTIVWDGATDEQVKNLAIAQIKVRAQSHFRKHGIPKTYQLKVAELSTNGSGLSQEQMDQMVIANALADPVKAKAMLDQLNAALNAAKNPPARK